MAYARSSRWPLLCRARAAVRCLKHGNRSIGSLTNRHDSLNIDTSLLIVDYPYKITPLLIAHVSPVRSRTPYLSTVINLAPQVPTLIDPQQVVSRVFLVGRYGAPASYAVVSQFSPLLKDSAGVDSVISICWG
jgi:hypothetical protein